MNKKALYPAQTIIAGNPFFVCFFFVFLQNMQIFETKISNKMIHYVHILKNKCCTIFKNKAKYYQKWYNTESVEIIQQYSRSQYTKYYKESLRLCVTKWWISSFISASYAEMHIWLFLKSILLAQLWYMWAVFWQCRWMRTWENGLEGHTGELKNVCLRRTEL